MPNSDSIPTTVDRTAAEQFLRAFRRQGVKRIFANLGTDHTPLLEAAASVRAAGDGDAIPEILSCPHEFAAMSAAHGYAVATGDPQVVLVHVDVGTQNLGAAMHNAHRADAPVFVLAGLAPVTDDGHSGARDHPVHYVQDVFDQPGIVREYCRWTDQYRPPADPAETVRRGLERAASEPAGPVYVTATREALSQSIESDPGGGWRRVTAGRADATQVERLVSRVRDAERPAVITSDIGRDPASERVEALVEFAETVGAGVIEQTPTTLCFPRDHEQHVGYDPTVALEHADLLILAESDVPWIPGGDVPDLDAPVVQVDTDPTKPTFPRWPFQVDETIKADAAGTLGAATERVDRATGEAGRAFWRDVAAARRADAEDRLAADREDGRLTPAVLSAALRSIVDDETVIIEDAVTSRSAILSQLQLSRPGSYFWKGGAGLGWAGGAAVGAKLADPDHRVLSLVGDGSYLFSNPAACALFAAEYDAPTLTIVYDNQGWNAVEGATTAQYPDGAAAEDSVPESRIDTAIDLSAPATVVDAHTSVVSDPDDLPSALEAAADAVDSGTPAVLDVKVERP